MAEDGAEGSSSSSEEDPDDEMEDESEEQRKSGVKCLGCFVSMLRRGLLSSSRLPVIVIGAEVACPDS